MKRLIEEWLPIAALGEESVRERRSMTALPPTYYLHVWWARRPLVASRAAILASILPHDTDRDRFMHILGIHGDPVASRRRIDLARRMGERFEGEAYTYKRAFTYNPSEEERAWIEVEMRRAGLNGIVALDPTAGGGSIPFEMRRLGFMTYANDLNPVAALILRATVEWPFDYGLDLLDDFQGLADEFMRRRATRLADLFPPEPEDYAVPTNFLWARTISCPYCDGLIPLAPNWRLAPDGTGMRLKPTSVAGRRRCEFEVVYSAGQQSEGTVSRGSVACPFADCRRVIDDSEVRRQACEGGMAQQLYAVVFKRPVFVRTKGGRNLEKWARAYRSPRPEDDVNDRALARLKEKMSDWEALGYIPTENVESAHPKYDPRRWGMNTWRSFFSARQLCVHVTSVEVYRELLDEARDGGNLTAAKRTAFGYLALCIDKMIDYNSKASAWHPGREITEHTFREHAFVYKWSYAEMSPLVPGRDRDWAVKQTSKCMRELMELARPNVRVKAKREHATLDLLRQHPCTPSPVSVMARSADDLAPLERASIDLVVIDPPYYDNVMYAELADFFYVWLRRTAGQVYPEFFIRPLTDKGSEAVASPSKFEGRKGAMQLAGLDYQQRMAGIFSECRRVLRPDGLMTLMFTHKATGAWDALTKGLMEADFVITASWPVSSEAEHSLHIKDKAAASSTVFLMDQV